MSENIEKLLSFSVLEREKYERVRKKDRPKLED